LTIHILVVAGLWIKVAELLAFLRDYCEKNWNYKLFRGINKNLAGFSKTAGIKPPKFEPMTSQSYPKCLHL
jgi:hypothetical protein